MRAAGIAGVVRAYDQSLASADWGAVEAASLPMNSEIGLGQRPAALAAHPLTNGHGLGISRRGSTTL